MRKSYIEYTKEELDSLMDRKWEKMRNRHTSWNTQFLQDMHELLDWYEGKLAKLNNPQRDA